jgi:hypothetical protein
MMDMLLGNIIFFGLLYILVTGTWALFFKSLIGTIILSSIFL